MRNHHPPVRPILLAVLLTGCLTRPAPKPQANSQTEWATRVTVAGVPNFHQITPTLYRGAQPDATGMRSLAKRGIRTIVNLRKFHSDKDELAAAGLSEAFDYIEIPTTPWTVDDEAVIAFLTVAQAPKMRPLFFHCQHGADRTGTMAAAFRIVIQGWTKDDAIREMTTGGFGFHVIWKSLPRYLESLDVVNIRKALAAEGVSTTPIPQ